MVLYQISSYIECHDYTVQNTELWECKACYCAMFICCTAAVFLERHAVLEKQQQTLNTYFLSIRETEAYLSVAVAVKQPVQYTRRH